MFAIIVFIVFLGFAIAQKLPIYYAMRKEAKYADEKFDEMKKYEMVLEEESQHLSDEAYLEQQARIKLDYQKPGERAVFVYHKDDDTIKENVQPSKSMSFFKRLWYQIMRD